MSEIPFLSSLSMLLVRSAAFLKDDELNLFAVTKTQYEIIQFGFAAIVMVTGGLGLWSRNKMFSATVIALLAMQIIFSMPMLVCFIKRNWQSQPNDTQASSE